MDEDILRDYIEKRNIEPPSITVPTLGSKKISTILPPRSSSPPESNVLLVQKIREKHDPVVLQPQDISNIDLMQSSSKMYSKDEDSNGSPVYSTFRSHILRDERPTTPEHSRIPSLAHFMKNR